MKRDAKLKKFHVEEEHKELEKKKKEHENNVKKLETKKSIFKKEKK
jgi:hypothetical protein